MTYLINLSVRKDQEVEFHREVSGFMHVLAEPPVFSLNSCSSKNAIFENWFKTINNNLSFVFLMIQEK